MLDKYLGLIDVSCGCRHRLQSIVDRPDADRQIKQITKQFDHPPIGAVADEDQRQNQLKQPVLGDRQIEEHGFILGGLSKGFVQGLIRFMPLLIEKRSADLVLCCEVADRFRFG